MLWTWSFWTWSLLDLVVFGTTSFLGLSRFGDLWSFLALVVFGTTDCKSFLGLGRVLDLVVFGTKSFLGLGRVLDLVVFGPGRFWN